MAEIRKRESIRVTEAASQIDRKEVKMLAYETDERECRENAMLTLTNITENQYKLFRSAIESFYFPENPVLGDKIAGGRDYAVYLLAKGDGKGSLYAGYLMRGALDVPLIICNHSYRSDEDNRERRPFDNYNMNRCLLDLSGKLTPWEAMDVLTAMQQQWGVTATAIRLWFGFWRLGIIDLDQLCRENGGYETQGESTNRERKYLDILERIAQDIFSNNRI